MHTLLVQIWATACMAAMYIQGTGYDDCKVWLCFSDAIKMIELFEPKQILNWHQGKKLLLQIAGLACRGMCNLASAWHLFFKKVLIAAQRVNILLS